MAHRSFSAVKSLRSCGEMYRLERVEKVTSRPSSAAVAGRVVHEATESIDLEIAAGETDEGTLRLLGHRLAGEILDVEIERNVSEAYPDPDSWRSFGRATSLKPRGEDIEWFRRVGIPDSVNSYIAWRLGNKHLEVTVFSSGLLAIEIPFEIQISGGTPIKGVIDRVFTNVDNGVNLCVDLKTGVKPKSTEQLGVYRQALVAGGMDVTYGAYLYGLKVGQAKQTPDIDLRMWTPEKLSAIYGQADYLIDKGIYIPNPGETCFFCSVSKECQFYPGSVL